MLHTQLTVFPR